MQGTISRLLGLRTIMIEMSIVSLLLTEKLGLTEVRDHTVSQQKGRTHNKIPF